MKKDSKSKAKSPTVKRAQKSVAKSTKATDKSKTVGASKVTSAKAKTAAVKAKTPAAKTKATKAAPAEKPEAKRAAKATTPAAESKQSGAKSGKRKVKIQDATGFRIDEPVLDPIGDVISGEARTYLGEVESQGQVEMEAYREETEISAVDGTLEAGPGMAAASGAGEVAAADEDEVEEETGAAERQPAKLERLQKILSRAGIASRRHAEEMIVAGRVMVNGQVVTQLGSKADAARDHIRVDGKLLHGAERHRYFVLNKPKGYMTTVSDPEGRPTVMEFFAKMGERLYPVGRLDYQSEGLLLMTNDGELANLVTKAGSGVEKTYLVKVAGQPSEEELERLRGGVTIERGEAGSERVRTAPARIRQVRVGENPWYEVVLTEGRNRELRKMFAAIGHFAEKIRRVGYGPLVLDVEPGKLRELTAEEVNALRLTAEGKIKPRRMRVDLTLPKEAGRAPGRRGERPARPWRDKPAGKRFGRREERGQRTEWKPRERTFGGGREVGAARSGERPRFDKRQDKPFGARPSLGRSGEGPNAGKTGGFGERPRPKFGERRPFSGGQRPFGGGRPSTGSKPRFERPGFKRPEFGGKPREQAAGRFENAPKKPFRAQGERPFSKPGEGPKKRFGGERGKGFGGGAESKRSWTPRPDRARNEEGRGQTGSGDRPAPAFREKRWEGKGASAGAGRPRPAFGTRPGAGRPRPPFGAKPGGFARPGKPGGFAKPGRPSGGANRGGPRPGGRPHGGQKRG